MTSTSGTEEGYQATTVASDSLIASNKLLSTVYFYIVILQEANDKARQSAANFVEMPHFYIMNKMVVNGLSKNK